MLKSFIKSEPVREHYNLCTKEFHVLQQKISNTNVSLYDVSFKPKKDVVKYLRNNDVLLAIQRNNTESSIFYCDLTEAFSDEILRIFLLICPKSFSIYLHLVQKKIILVLTMTIWKISLVFGEFEFLGAISLL